MSRAVAAALLLAALAVAANVAAASSVVDCGSSAAAFKLYNYTISPDPIKLGAPARVQMAGSLLRQLTNGTIADVVVKLNSQVIYEDTVDVCELGAEEGLCPIQPQYIEIDRSFDVPSLPIRPSTVYAIIRGTDQNGGEAICLDIELDIVR